VGGRPPGEGQPSVRAEPSIPADPPITGPRPAEPPPRRPFDADLALTGRPATQAPYWAA
jgi:hypothetical protein